MTFAVRLIVENNEGEILFLHQTKLNGGKYSLVGGTVKPREFAQEALCREVYEEVGLKIDAKDLDLVHTLHRHKLKKEEVLLVLVFKARRYYGIPTSLEPQKFQKVKWLNPKNLPSNVSGATKHMIEQILLGVNYSEYPQRKQVLDYWEQHDHLPTMF